MAAAPPILSAAPIAMILGLDGALALVVGLIATLLTPLTVPPLAFVLLGLELDLGAMEFMARLGVAVVVAVAAAVVIRRAARKSVVLGKRWSVGVDIGGCREMEK